MDFEILHNNFQRVLSNLDDIVLESAMENETSIADLNTNQLSKGLTNAGELINPEYASDGYAILKKAEGGQAPLYTPDLHDTGDFYHGFFAKITDKAIVIDSTDSKSDDLKAKYKGIMGLNDESLKELGQMTLPILNERILNELTSS